MHLAHVNCVFEIWRCEPANYSKLFLLFRISILDLSNSRVPARYEEVHNEDILDHLDTCDGFRCNCASSEYYISMSACLAAILVAHDARILLAIVASSLSRDSCKPCTGVTTQSPTGLIWKGNYGVPMACH